MSYSPMNAPLAARRYSMAISITNTCSPFSTVHSKAGGVIGQIAQPTLPFLYELSFSRKKQTVEAS